MATNTPSGISTASTDSENTSWRYRAECSSGSRIVLRNHSMPTNTRWSGPRMSCTE
jgi:hypothetical protein